MFEKKMMAMVGVLKKNLTNKNEKCDYNTICTGNMNWFVSLFHEL